jgi:hypothetical protein
MIIPFVFAWMRELGAVSRSNTENASSQSGKPKSDDSGDHDFIPSLCATLI